MMLEAMQMWVDSAINAKPRVVAVRQFAAQPYPEPGTPAFYEIDVHTELPVESPAPFIPASGGGGASN